MKLDPDIYHLNTFHIPKNEGVNDWVGGGASKKQPKNAIKLTKSLSLPCIIGKYFTKL